MAKNIGYTPGKGGGKATKKMTAAGKKSQNSVISSSKGKTAARLIQSGSGNSLPRSIRRGR